MSSHRSQTGRTRTTRHRHRRDSQPGRRGDRPDPTRRVADESTDDNDGTLVVSSDPARFSEMFGRWWPTVWSAARTCVDDDEDADDAAQDVFATLWTRGQGKVIRAPQTYFAQAGRNAGLKVRRLVARFVQISDQGLEKFLGSSGEPETELHRRRRVALLRQMLEDLPPRCRAVMSLVYIVGLTRRQTAEELGVTLGAVEKQITRGRRLLRERRTSR